MSTPSRNHVLPTGIEADESLTTRIDQFLAKLTSEGYSHFPVQSKQLQAQVGSALTAEHLGDLTVKLDAPWKQVQEGKQQKRISRLWDLDKSPDGGNLKQQIIAKHCKTLKIQATLLSTLFQCI